MTINEYTGIDTRSAIGTIDHPLVNMDRAPNVAELSEMFMKEGVALAVTAAQKAIAEAGIDSSDITHVVSTTCTNSANPGFDHYVCKQLGISHTVEKILLHGIGCSGGLAALRTAANIAMGSSFRRRPARVLVIALEICSFLVRSEMDSIDELQETRIGITLFSDCASSLVLSNGLGSESDKEPVYELLGWEHRIIPDTEQDLGFDVDPLGKAFIGVRSDDDTLTYWPQAGKLFFLLGFQCLPRPPYIQYFRISYHRCPTFLPSLGQQSRSIGLCTLAVPQSYQGSRKPWG